jgi:TfoX/Sxy family transcriptional regulator of competence genes
LRMERLRRVRAGALWRVASFVCSPIRIGVGSLMAYDAKLANRIRQVFGARGDIAERKMFGGLAFLCSGRTCCGIVGSDLIVRVSDDEYDAIVHKPHVRPMDFTGRPLRGFVYVSPPGLRTAAALRTWLSRGERVAEEKAAQPTRPSGRRKTPSAAAPGQTSRARRSH